MFEPVGYCTIKKDAKSGTAQNINKFLGKDVRVMEFARDGGVLVVSSDAQEMAMFDKEDVIRKFECTISDEYILPPNLDMLEQMAYKTKLMTRKGGYNNILRNMVIQYGLMKGVYNDDFLFQKEREENARNEREGKPAPPMSPAEMMATTLMAVYAPPLRKAHESRKEVAEFRKARNAKSSEIEQKIFLFQDELDKIQNGYWRRRAKPRRLRRILRRLKNSLHKI